MPGSDSTEGKTAMNSNAHSDPGLGGSVGPPIAKVTGAMTTTATTACSAVELTGGIVGDMRPAMV